MEPTIHQVERRERRGRRAAALLVLAMIGIVAATWVGLFSFLGANSAYGTVGDVEAAYICDPTVYDLGFPDLGSLSKVYTDSGIELGTLTERNSQPVPIEDIPDTILHALLAAEDAGFYEHEGVDFKAIFRAVVADISGTSASLQGGSTITQQIVKQNILTDERTIERKVCEAVVAAELEELYTKDEILEFYANWVFLGSNAYGVKAAAQEYWNKDLEDVTIAEAAAMFTPIRNPTTYDLRRNPENVLRARNAVISEMLDNEFITPAEAAVAKATPLEPLPHEEFTELVPQAVIAAREELLNSPEYGLGDTFLERKRAIFGCPASDTECEGGGGLKVFLTLDYDLQQEATRILRAWFNEQELGITGALAMVDNATGAIRVMAGGREFGTDIEAGQRPYDLATKGRRNPGSSFKPFALISALENGSSSGAPITLGSYWDYTDPQEIDCGYPCSPEGNIWTCHNANRSGEGIRTLESATYWSTNTVFCQVSLAVGPDNIVETAHRLGIDSPLNPVLSITLGTQAVTPLEMAAAYSTVANYGVKHDTYLIERIEDAAGNVVYQHESDPQQVLDPALAAAVVNTMQKVVSQGTGTNANIGRPQAGKTGTHQNYTDAWFVGYIPQYSTAVWVGHPDEQLEMRNFVLWDDVNQKWQSYSRAFGGTVAAPIWKQFMLYATEDLPVMDFPEDPPGTSVYYQVPMTEAPDLTELTLEEAKDAVYKSGLNWIQEDKGSLEPEETIIGQDPEPGTRLRQGQSVTVEVSTGEPPEAPLIDLSGLTLQEATSALTEFSEEFEMPLAWERADLPTANPLLLDRVVATAPAAGDVVTAGDTITLFIGVPPAPAGDGP
jgi:penicillin-binding protein 1A